VDVDGVARRRDERGIARLEEHPHEVDEALLCTHGRDDLCLGVELDAEAAAVEVCAGEPELRDAAGGRVAVVVGLRGGLLQLRHSNVGRGKVGVPEAEVDDVLAGTAQVERQLADRREDVRRERVDAAQFHTDQLILA
jgi:hypothetical protein